MKILYFSITSKLNTDSILIFRRVLLSKLDRNRAGYMTDWLMVNGILMYFFFENTSTSRRPSDHVLAEILDRLFCLGYSHHSLDLIICPFLGASEPLNININRSSICGLCEWCCTIPELHVKPRSKGMEEFIMLHLFMFYTRWLPKQSFFVYLGIH